jgi:Peptidase A4 family
MRHRFRRLSVPLVACVATLGLMAALGSAASASTAPSRAAQRAEAVTIARNALKHLLVGWHGTNHAVTVRTPGIKASTPVESTNWSGYADVDETFSDVKGSWKEPSASCTSTTSLAAFWVGIDGYSSDSVEQDGTLIECLDSTAYQFSWWEMYPTNDIQVVGESVAAGDHITASVTRTGTSYKLKVKDATTPANSFTTTQTCSDCDNSSAEWIAEAPCCSGSSVYPLSDFHSWTLTGGKVSTTAGSGVISTYPNYAITMIGSSGDTLAAPGPLNAAGKQFKDTWENST